MQNTQQPPSSALSTSIGLSLTNVEAPHVSDFVPAPLPTKNAWKDRGPRGNGFVEKAPSNQERVELGSANQLPTKPRSEREQPAVREQGRTASDRIDTNILKHLSTESNKLLETAKTDQDVLIIFQNFLIIDLPKSMNLQIGSGHDIDATVERLTRL